MAPPTKTKRLSSLLVVVTFRATRVTVATYLLLRTNSIPSSTPNSSTVSRWWTLVGTPRAHITVIASRSLTTRRQSSRRSACIQTWRTQRRINSFSTVLLGWRRANSLAQTALQRSCQLSSQEPFYSKDRIRRLIQLCSSSSRYSTLLGKLVRISNNSVEADTRTSSPATPLAIEATWMLLPMLQRTVTSRVINSQVATMTSGAYLCLVPSSLSTTSRPRI